MLDEMPSELFAEWRAFFELEPFGSEVDAARSAQMSWIYANSNRKQGSPSRPLRDFIIGGDESEGSREERAAQRAAWQAKAAEFDAQVEAAFKAAEKQRKEE